MQIVLREVNKTCKVRMDYGEMRGTKAEEENKRLRCEKRCR